MVRQTAAIICLDQSFSQDWCSSAFKDIHEFRKSEFPSAINADATLLMS